MTGETGDLFRGKGQVPGEMTDPCQGHELAKVTGEMGDLFRGKGQVPDEMTDYVRGMSQQG